MTNDILTQERLKELLHYDQETGIFTWLADAGTRVKCGDVAGYIRDDKYQVISLDGKDYYAHRLAFLYVNGVMPKHCVDHADGDTKNNRWPNLRAATVEENSRNKSKQSNNTSGYKGVYWNSYHEKWVAQCRVKGRKIYGGYFDDPYLASLAYQEIAKKHHGEFYKA